MVQLGDRYFPRTCAFILGILSDKIPPTAPEARQPSRTTHGSARRRTIFRITLSLVLSASVSASVSRYKFDRDTPLPREVSTFASRISDASSRPCSHVYSEPSRVLNLPRDAIEGLRSSFIPMVEVTVLCHHGDDTSVEPWNVFERGTSVSRAKQSIPMAASPSCHRNYPSSIRGNPIRPCTYPRAKLVERRTRK